MIKNKVLYDIWIQRIETSGKSNTSVITGFNQKTKRELNITSGATNLIINKGNEYAYINSSLNNPYLVYFDGITDINFYSGGLYSETFNSFATTYDVVYDFTDKEVVSVVCNGYTCIEGAGNDYTVTGGNTVHLNAIMKTNYNLKTYGNQITVMYINKSNGVRIAKNITYTTTAYTPVNIDYSKLSRTNLATYMTNSYRWYKLNLNEFSVSETPEKIILPSNKKRDGFTIVSTDKSISTSHYSPCDELGQFDTLMDIIKNETTDEYIGEEFRIMLYSATENIFTMYEGCVLEAEPSFSEQIDANSYSYTIPFQLKYSWNISLV